MQVVEEMGEEQAVRSAGADMRRRALFATWLTIGLVVTGGLFPAAVSAQPSSEGNQATQENAAAEVPAQLRTPRASMRTFLEALADGRLDDAAQCLDLSETGLSPRLRAVRGPELATRLKRALDRVQLIVYEEIPDERHAAPVTFYDGARGLIRLDRSADGAWRFDPETIERLPETLHELDDREVVEGVEEVPLTRAQWLRAQVPERLREVGFLLEHWQWIGIVIVVVLGVVVDLVARLLLGLFVARRIAARTNLETAEIHTALRPVGLMAMAALWWFALGWLGLPERPLAVLGVAIEVVAIAGLIWTFYRLVDLVSGWLRPRVQSSDSRVDDMLMPLFERSTKILVVVFGLIFLADSLQVPIASLLAGVGIGGIAIALAAQDLVKNLFGSVTVLLDRPFEVGDSVAIGDIEGTVIEVAFRSTRIRTFYDSVITLPNSNLISAAVDNKSRRRYRRWTTKIGLAYETPPEKVEAFCERLRQSILEHPLTRKESFYVEFNEFGDSALQVLVYFFFETTVWADELRGRHEIGLEILRLAEELDIEIAYPTRTLYLRQGDDEPSREEEPTREDAGAD